MRHALLIICLFGCGHPAPRGEPLSPDEDIQKVYRETEDRLTSRFIDKGFVVSLGKDQRKGDSLLWTGITLGAVDCSQEAVRGGIWEAIRSSGGELSRHPDLPREISLDGALGLYWGIAGRIAHCPNEIPGWKDLLGIHKTYIDAHYGAINGNFVVPPEFDFIQQALFAKVGLDVAPKASRVHLLADEVASWAYGVKASHSACYRVHLGWLALSAAEALGYPPSQTDRARFCDAESGLDLPVVDHWCGRDGLKNYLGKFEYNQWDYRHQRCPAWEGPDGAGEESPAVDRLVGLQQLYNL